MKKNILLCVLVLSLSSCSWLAFSVLRPNKPEIKVLVNSVNHRKIVFIPMYHVNKPEFYAEVKEKVSSLRNEGYVVFYELVKFAQKHDSLKTDTLLRKYRKIVGREYGKYTDEDNESSPKYLKQDKYVNQSLENTGVSREKDIWVDLSVGQIIEKYEEKYGEIELTSCDYQTGFFEKYECEEAGHSFYATMIARDEYISKKVLNSQHKKIVMIYGAQHWYFIWPNLREAGFEIIKGKI